VPVAVEKEAIQTVDGKQVVYRRVKEGFVAQPVTVGRSDGRKVEIVAGLAAAATYAASHSFTIKAEQGKALRHDD
jgi:cobalt-zinc-cadmium efflux system membrane fusion protein